MKLPRDCANVCCALENSERGGRKKEVGKEGERKEMGRKRKGGRRGGKRREGWREREKRRERQKRKVTLNYSGVNKLLFS